MPKATISFDLDEIDDRNEFKRAASATDAYICISRILDEVFRPHRKHGYDDSRIQSIIDRMQLGDEENPGLDLIELLEERFHEILESSGISLEDL